jgi:DNA-binding MarR family transcriptional regulator
MERRRLSPAQLEEMEGCFCAALRRTTRAVTQLYDTALRPLKLRSTQLPILVATSRFGRVPLAALAERLGMDRTTLLRNVRPLLRRKLVEVVTEQGSRRAELRPTPAGSALLARVLPGWRAAQASALESVGGLDWSRALEAMSRVAAGRRR